MAVHCSSKLNSNIIFLFPLSLEYYIFFLFFLLSCFTLILSFSNKLSDSHLSLILLKLLLIHPSSSSIHHPPHRCHESSRIITDPRTIVDLIHHPPHPSLKPNSVHPSSFTNLLILYLGVCVCLYMGLNLLCLLMCMCLNLGLY